ncbi:MAG: hypothetical protein LBV04_08530, partial [Deferribacteraceae bacterium]|nr:hypothetical protein [Deferribacteraceae bacterium]
MNKLIEHSLYIYVALVAIFAALFATSVLNYVLTEAVMPSMPQPVRSEGSSRSQVAIGVTERNIFGIEKSLPMLATTGEYSDSGFGGKLTGVLLGSTLASSRAIIVDGGGQVLVVKSEANPNAPEGAPVYLLTDIGKDFAVVSFNGQERSLRLEAGDTSSAPPSGAS